MMQQINATAQSIATAQQALLNTINAAADVIAASFRDPVAEAVGRLRDEVEMAQSRALAYRADATSALIDAMRFFGTFASDTTRPYHPDPNDFISAAMKALDAPASPAPAEAPTPPQDATAGQEEAKPALTVSPAPEPTEEAEQPAEELVVVTAANATGSATEAPALQPGEVAPAAREEARTVPSGKREDGATAATPAPAKAKKPAHKPRSRKS